MSNNNKKEMEMSEKVLTMGQLIQVYREKFGYNLEEAKKQIRISWTTYKDIETDKNPQFGSLKRVVDYYKIPLEELKKTKNCHINFTMDSSVETPLKKKKLTIVDMLRNIEDLIDNVHELDITGGIADKLKEEALQNIMIAKAGLSEVQILDKLL